MRYFVLLIALVLSSCSHDDNQVNDGWVRIDGESWVLKPMVENVPSGWNSLGCGGRKMYINKDGSHLF